MLPRWGFVHKKVKQAAAAGFATPWRVQKILSHAAAFLCKVQVEGVVDMDFSAKAVDGCFDLLEKCNPPVLGQRPVVGVGTEKRHIALSVKGSDAVVQLVLDVGKSATF